MNDYTTQLRTFLATFYAVAAGSDNTTLVVRYLAGLTGDYTNRWKQMMTDAGIPG